MGKRFEAQKETTERIFSLNVEKIKTFLFGARVDVAEKKRTGV